MTVRLQIGDALARLAQLPDDLADCCVTSPPYYRQRNYEVDGQTGQESTPEAFIDALLIELNPGYAQIAQERLRAAMVQVDSEATADLATAGPLMEWNNGQTRGCFDSASSANKRAGNFSLESPALKRSTRERP